MSQIATAVIIQNKDIVLPAWSLNTVSVFCFYQLCLFKIYNSLFSSTIVLCLTILLRLIYQTYSGNFHEKLVYSCRHADPNYALVYGIGIPKRSYLADVTDISLLCSMGALVCDSNLHTVI